MVKIILLCALFFASLIIQGNCQCVASDIEISQSETGKTVQNKAERQVIIQNKCICTAQEIELDCKGFQTAEPIDPSILALNQRAPGQCLLLNGQVLHGSRLEKVSFKYASDAQFPFKAISLSYACS